MKVFFAKVWAAIKYAVTFKWLIKREIVIIPVEQKGQVPPDEKFLGIPQGRLENYKNLIKKLDECMYGSIYERETPDGRKRPAHRKNGWRHGVDHPFDMDGKVYLRKETNSENVKLYRELRRKINAKFGILEDI